MKQPAGPFTFGLGGNAASCLGEGWSAPEAGFTWTSGTHSRLRLPLLRPPGGLLLELALAPLVAPPRLAQQRLIVTVNDAVIGDEPIAAECVIGLPVPPDVVDGKYTLDISLHCPGATTTIALGTGSDPRVLGIALHAVRLTEAAPSAPCTVRTRAPLPEGISLPDAVRRATGLSLGELSENFESLGHDCEFGLAQRQMGTERLGLLRFTGISPHHLRLGLEQQFSFIDAPGNLAVFTHDDGPEAEFMVRDATYGMEVHTHRHAHTANAASLLPSMYGHLRLLRGKLLEDLGIGHKICVFNYPGTRTVNQIRPLLNTLRRFGPNTLLFVNDNGAEAPGTVRREEAGLLQGWIGELGRERAGVRLDLAAWVNLCANAFVLWQDKD